ncbi:MAG: NADH:flavin oxidoreductase, partial [Nitrospirae bacterium]|nr:NADH:flavin oxidoreductase [Nitrospirota bacterium]
GRIFIQLVHGGRQCFPSLLGGAMPIAPSEVYESLLKVTPRAMSGDEAWMLVEAFGQAARRAVEAGFDGVQIHGAHGYLVNQFLSPYTNRRDDYWGGDEQRRFNFLKEVYGAIRKAAPPSFPVLIKLNARDFDTPKGLDLPESLRIAKRLEALGIDGIEVSGGIYESDIKAAKENILTKADEAYFRDAAAAFKAELKVPVIAVGGFRSRSVIESTLQTGMADLVSMSRPLIREPDLPNKFAAGKDSADCISCNGCMRFMKLDVVRCAQLKV